MANTDIEQLVVQMSADFRSFQQEFAKANGVATKTFNEIQRKAWQTDKQLDQIGKNMARSLMAPLAGGGAALGARELIDLTDTWTDLNARVRIAAGGIREGADTMERLSEVARRTYSDLELTAEGYLANSTALRELGYTTSQTLDYVEAVNNAMVVSGAKGQRSTAVMNNLSQAMQLGSLQGQNLTYILQNGGRVTELLAEELGVATTQLKALGKEGKLTGDLIYRVLTKNLERLRDEADSMEATIGDAFILLRNSFLEYVGGMDQAAGASLRIAEAIILVADNLDGVANAALAAATAISGALAGRAIVGAIGQVRQLSLGLAAFVAAARSAQNLSGVIAAFTSLGAAANPVALILGGATALAIGHYINKTRDAETRTEVYANLLDRLGIAAKDAADAIDGVADAQDRVSTAEGIAKHLAEQEAAAEAYAKATAEIDRLMQRMRLAVQTADEHSDVLQQEARDLVRVTDEFQNKERSIESLRAEYDRLAVAMPDWAAGIAQLMGFAVEADNAALAMGRLADEAERVGMATGSKFSSFRADLATRMAPILEGQKYLTEQERRNALTKEQRDLEDEMARIRKDMPDGAFLSDKQVADLAAANMAAKESSKSSGKSRSPQEQYSEAIKSFEQRMHDIERESQLLAGISAAYDDYGYAVEKARAQLELENAAAKSGLALTPERRAEIEQLAESYARVTSEASRLADAQSLLRQSIEELGQAGRQALDTIIDGFIEGKDAGEIFNSVVKDLAKNLLSMGLDLIGGGMKTGGFNPLGFVSGLLGFATGTANTGGRRGEPRGIVHGQEAVIPLPNGGRVPVDIRAPSLTAGGQTAPSELRVHIVSDDEKFSAYVTDKAGRVVAQSAPAIVATSVGQASKAAPAAVANYQQQRAGSDYRTM